MPIFCPPFSILTCPTEQMQPARLIAMADVPLYGLKTRLVVVSSGRTIAIQMVSMRWVPEFWHVHYGCPIRDPSIVPKVFYRRGPSSSSTPTRREMTLSLPRLTAATVTLTIDLETPEAARIIFDALQPETHSAPSDRARADIRLDRSTVVIDITASDLPALRASMNSFLAWISACERTLRAIGDGDLHG